MKIYVFDGKLRGSNKDIRNFQSRNCLCSQASIAAESYNCMVSDRIAFVIYNRIYKIAHWINTLEKCLTVSK